MKLYTTAEVRDPTEERTMKERCSRNACFEPAIARVTVSRPPHIAGCSYLACEEHADEAEGRPSVACVEELD